jgi:hypothetical protein
MGLLITWHMEMDIPKEAKPIMHSRLGFPVAGGNPQISRTLDDSDMRMDVDDADGCWRSCQARGAGNLKRRGAPSSNFNGR